MAGRRMRHRRRCSKLRRTPTRDDDVQSAPTAAPGTPVDYRWLAAASLLLSLWLIATDPLINRDAIIYLRTAETYLQNGFGASQQLFGRPLLSILFATVHQVTGLPLVYAGLLVNSLFYALLCVAFVATLHTLGGDRRVQLIGAIVILSHPVLNEHRSSIMRDPAFLAMLVLSLRELLLYARDPRAAHQLRWLGCILLATLFRFEGLFFALLAPLSLLCCRDLPRRLHHCLRMLLPPFLVAALSAAALALYQSGLDPGARVFPGIGHYLDQLADFPSRFGATASASAELMLEFTAREDASLALLAALMAILLLNICRALTWPWVITLLWGWRARLQTRLRRDDHRVLLVHLCISLAYLVAFTLINRFMLERYAIHLVVFLLLYLAFILNALWQAGSRQALRRWVVAALLLVMTLDTLHNRNHEKAFVRDATEWLAANAPPGATLVSNEHYLAYFSGLSVDWREAEYRGFDLRRILASPDFWRTRDYLAMRVRREDQEAWEAFLRRYSLQETAVFDGGRHGKVSIVALDQHRAE